MGGVVCARRSINHKRPSHPEHLTTTTNTPGGRYGVNTISLRVNNHEEGTANMAEERAAQVTMQLAPSYGTGVHGAR